MGLFPGYFVDRTTDVASRIVVKISSSQASDHDLDLEKKMITVLHDQPGFPKLVMQGKAWVEHYDANYRPIKRWSPFFVMPEIAGVDLAGLRVSQWQLAFPTREKLAWLAGHVLPQLAERLATLHELGIVHRDVKPNNALYSEAEGVTVLDFGHANYLQGREARTDHGTVGYFPPELILGTPEREDVRADVYGFGTSAFVLLTGEVNVLYSGMTNLFRMTGFDFMFTSREEVTRRYYSQMSSFAHLTPEALLKVCNMPVELKETGLGKYLIGLFHPAREQRPENMHQVAEAMRRLGGELETIDVWEPRALL
jgi:serine/threonine protein kinase